VLHASTAPAYQLLELLNARREQARGALKALWEAVNRQLYAVIRERRAAGPAAERHDVLSSLLEARDEAGRPLTDEELRDELVTLLLAGHETTASSLAWTFERLTRAPSAYDRLRELTRSGSEGDAAAYVAATLHEAMRVRPVVPIISRRVYRPWRLGSYVVAAGTQVAVNIIALHHRPDTYPEPEVFSPERFLDHKPPAYSWIPFGGGIRRCLGASVAMAEQRIVLRAIAEHLDLRVDRPSPEGSRIRSVTMIPSRGGRVVVDRRLG
jgi:cytochrome P450